MKLINILSVLVIVTLVSAVFSNNIIAQTTYNFGDVQRLTGANNELLQYISNSTFSTSMAFKDSDGIVYGRVHGNTNGASFGLLDGDQDWSYRAVKDEYTSFSINDLEKMRIQSNGNVGIGTIAPEVQLHIDGGTDLDLASGGYLQLGKSNSVNIAMDNNEIQVRNNGSPSFLHLQAGGGALILVNGGGNVGVGTNAPTKKLDVCGAIRGHEMIVEEGWCDFVFDDDYDLPTLEEEKQHIETEGYLLGFESEAEMAGEINVGDVTKRQQQKIEESILHIIRLSEENKALATQNKDLNQKYDELLKVVTSLQEQIQK